MDHFLSLRIFCSTSLHLIINLPLIIISESEQFKRKRVVHKIPFLIHRHSPNRLNFKSDRNDRKHDDAPNTNRPLFPPKSPPPRPYSPLERPPSDRFLSRNGSSIRLLASDRPDPRPPPNQPANGWKWWPWARARLTGDKFPSSRLALPCPRHPRQGEIRKSRSGRVSERIERVLRVLSFGRASKEARRPEKERAVTAREWKKKTKKK